MIRLSELIADVDEIAELDINPLLVDAEGVIALDARIVVRAPAAQERAARFAIKPYPVELETEIVRSRRREALHPADPARRRAAAAGLLATADAGGHPHALLRADARAHARDGGAAHPDRLRPRDGLPAARRQGASGRRPARRRSRLRAGGVRAGRRLRPAGARLRHAAAAITCCTTPRRAASSGWSATCCARTTRCSSSASGWASGARAGAPASPISGS